MREIASVYVCLYICEYVIERVRVRVRVREREREGDGRRNRKLTDAIFMNRMKM
jgi:hypothetical protein